jgi:hypothetical protein
MADVVVGDPLRNSSEVRRMIEQLTWKCKAWRGIEVERGVLYACSIPLGEPGVECGLRRVALIALGVSDCVPNPQNGDFVQS